LVQDSVGVVEVEHHGVVLGIMVTGHIWDLSEVGRLGQMTSNSLLLCTAESVSDPVRQPPGIGRGSFWLEMRRRWKDKGRLSFY